MFSGPMEDRLAIRDLHDAYCDAVLCRDPEDWGALWTEDAVWSLMGTEVVGRDNIVNLWNDALSHEGCLCYSWATDMHNPSRIEVFKESTDEEALARHFRDVHYASMRDHIGSFGLINAVSAKYRVDADAPLYNAEGKPTPAFD